jgi:16S rRNA (uracil1498-N3)-methyltransferase
MSDRRIRLFLDQPLSRGQAVAASEAQAHYLWSVMRVEEGAGLLAFNANDGEWRVTVARAGKRGAALTPDRRLRPPAPPPDLWLLFAPLKKARTDFLVEKAVEMGVARLQPVETRRTASDKVRPDRLQALAVEAAEQCGATHVPDIAGSVALPKLLAAWPAGRTLFWADEARAGAAGSWTRPEGALADAILIGPEGGFAEDERALLSRLPFAVPVALGPRILRAETAAVAALTLWQDRFGDWARPGSDA